MIKPISKKGKFLRFPDDFLWGVSTSSHQIEGGNLNDWSEWESAPARIEQLKQAGKDPDDYICGLACDSYNRYKEDASLVKELGCGAYRFGIEWSRIEPEDGKFNLAEVKHYRDVLEDLRERGLRPVVTLWHWTNPSWLARSGGWTNKEVAAKYLRYVEFIVKELGEYVHFWVTLNEPMAHIGFGYLRGNFPPGKRGDIIGAIKTYKNLVKAHNSAYQIIHRHFSRAQVGFTSLTDYFEPADKRNPLDQMLNSIFRYFHHRMFLNAVSKRLDFIGVDYYFHQKVSWWPPFKRNENKKVNDMGWEIFPEGIYHVLKYLARFKKPIYIMENGLADAADAERADFIRDHLSYVHQAIVEGIDVRGYFYWSLLDNFEWAHGFGPKFGLFAVDRKTFARIKRPSADVYADICKKNGLVA